MDLLQECALAFSHLLDFQYRCILGRKNHSHSITIAFSPYDFKHLAGLHYIKHPSLYGNSERVFKNIISGSITLSYLEKGAAIEERVHERIRQLAYLEQFMDSNTLVFGFSKNRATAIYTKIDAEYLLKNESCIDKTPVFFFLVKQKGNYYGNSFFADKEKDYSRGQTKYSLLYKEKINIKTGESIVQYDKYPQQEKADKTMLLSVQPEASQQVDQDE